MARPKREFTDEDIELMGKYALSGGQNNTIATAMNIPFNTLKRRFGKLLTLKRAERKLILRGHQTNQAVTSTQMAIFLGKNELGQQDKQTIVGERPVEVPESQKAAYEDAAKTIKLRLSKTSPA